MAEEPKTELLFSAGCPDCARREVVNLPRRLPQVGDDFDWLARDYDGFRVMMLEELSARIAERGAWTPADLEVVLVEVMAAALDQISDTADRVAAEKTLETARRPESVRRLLRFIGYDAARVAFADGRIKTDPGESQDQAAQQLEALFAASPWTMAEARAAGPLSVHTQRRMVTVDDYARLLEDHPLVLRASASTSWGGIGPLVRVAVVLWGDHALDEGSVDFTKVKAAITRFNALTDLPAPDWKKDPDLDHPIRTIRTLLAPYVEAYRMAGQEVILTDVEPVGIFMDISVRIDSRYFQSALRAAIREALGRSPGGFFEPGRLRFGESLYASDILQVLTALDGVDAVCLERFKRVGARFADQAGAGVIVLSGTEIAVCDDDRSHAARGYYRLTLVGGRPG